MKSNVDELTALCPYCLDPGVNIWWLRNHIRKYHGDKIVIYKENEQK